MNEFDLIARLFAPLAVARPGALGLTDDAALWDDAPGEETVLTADMLVAGVHFFADDPPDLIARKALRVNLSDLAAKGAKPESYLLTVAFPQNVTEAWLTAFAQGLAEDAKIFDFAPIGGDTVATSGPFTLSVAALGRVPKGQALLRSNARAGDLIFVSGTIGDAVLGLRVAKGEDLGLSAADNEPLLARYRLPEPRVKLGQMLRGVAHAALDISDGLMADLEHICETSRMAAEIDAARVPLSVSAQKALARNPALLMDVLTGGDDYELLFTAAPAQAARLTEIARDLDIALSPIGRMMEGSPHAMARDARGELVAFAKGGYSHF